MFSELIRHLSPPLDLIGTPWGHLVDSLGAIWIPRGHFGGILGAHGFLWGHPFGLLGDFVCHVGLPRFIFRAFAYGLL